MGGRGPQPFPPGEILGGRGLPGSLGRVSCFWGLVGDGGGMEGAPQNRGPLPNWGITRPLLIFILLLTGSQCSQTTPKGCAPCTTPSSPPPPGAPRDADPRDRDHREPPEPLLLPGPAPGVAPGVGGAPLPRGARGDPPDPRVPLPRPPRHRPDLAPGVSPRARGGPPELPLAPGGGGHPGGPPGGPGGAGRGGEAPP
ncbi:basic proline-rich protein-like [Corapipo altera]|uniref:basic proline-rich protein-like n=1 Tax=Corapipo altera TaxID=415028 RepID=UPI000FD64F1D|nr:basic proline-rich protein-like [Corapipo altera]